MRSATSRSSCSTARPRPGGRSRRECRRAADVAELNANLAALGYGDWARAEMRSRPRQRRRSMRSSRARGITPTGTLLLGSVVFEPGAVRVTGVTPTLGATVQPGPVLTVTSTARQVQIALDAASSSRTSRSATRSRSPCRTTARRRGGSPTSARSRRRRRARATRAAARARRRSRSNVDPDRPGGDRPPRPGAGERLDHDRERRERARRAGGRTARARRRRLRPRGDRRRRRASPRRGDLGLFDDADGLVQVSGAGLAAGQRVVVPSE